MGVKFTNNAETTLSSGINNSVTSISVASSSTFPSISGSNYFYATLDDGTNNEVVKVTAISGTTWTVTRAQDDTTARAFSSGDTVELRLNVALLEDALGDAATFARDSFTGDGSTTAFTLSQTAASENNLIVFIEGVFQTQSAYSLSGTTLTFSAAPANTREIIVYSTQALSAGTVVTASIVDDNVTQAKIADDAVGADQLASNAVVTASIVNDNVTQAKIADDAVGADQLASNAVVTASIVDDAVTTAKILDDNVTLAKMAGLARGKIIYGDSSGNPAALAVGSNGQVLKSDGTDISWGTDSGAITAVNNATANELVTIGSTTTELDAEANLTFDGSALQVTGTLTVGVNDTGHDVKFFGATSGAYMLWDESTDDLKLVGAAGLTVAGAIDIDGLTNLDAVDIDGAVQLDSTLTVGVDDTGYDVKLFGATASKYMLWDESADSLIVKDIVDAVNFKINGGQGSDGQVLTSTGSGVAWEAVSAGATSLTENNSIWLGNDPSSTTNSAEGNVAVGTTALDAITTGDNNVAIGYMALSALQIKDNNIAIGKDTLLAFGDSSSSSDGHNIAIGTDALTTTTNGSYNVAIGGGSQYDATGDYNVSTGMWSLYEVSTGGKNVAIGHKALYNMTTGSENVAVGYEALLSASSSGASANTAVGYQALKSCSSGTYNVAVGREALLDCAGGNYNVGIGRAALENVNSAEENVAVGYGAGNTWSTNGKNVALGHLAGETTGTTCVGGIWIGYGAGSTEAIDGGKQGQTVIGYGAQCGNVEQVVVIGKNMNSVGTNWISIGHSDDARVSINDSSGTAWTYPSDERMKENIADMPASAGLSFIKTLKPRTFTWRKKEDYDTSLVALRGKIQQDGDTTKKAEGTQYGFIAQEAKTAMEAAGLTADNDGGGYGFWTRDVSSGSGGMQGVSKEDLIPSLVKAIQELEARLAALE